MLQTLKKSVAKRYMYMDPSRLAMQDPVYVRKNATRELQDYRND
jgi:hypothetical protein